MRPMLQYYYIAGTILDVKTKKQAYVFIILGVFKFISGICSGYISDRDHFYMVATTSTIIVELALIVSIISDYTDNYTLCFIAGALLETFNCLLLI
ncbi:unnamed protein product (macronuclear) [Paramecium tetraurelia]|uniref:Major facilitator superfamily (MFS) profile domain-containing protein n=1 Tax=Paramecium tetraurelia TaxID=5888 RepID=A0BB73_PARTE|nr:uncharacterized protein GSPATT00000225001 [Paramecium tetraurelia]CAK55790.1 unnamed protein product [Paramecium tetraurelia]|eukprot:XP_001423188.1 hypothetical protein (macronuclear) [Paramecium tetraurelia strain d4-2]